MKRSSLRYVVLLAAMAGSLIAGIAALNYFVDPYDVFGCNRLGVYVAADRESRPSFIERYPHDAVLLGTSKAAMIDTTQLGPYRFFSVTFGGATVEELFFFADAYFKDLKLAVIALDFGMFSRGAAVEQNPFTERDIGYYLPFLFSLATAEDSVQTVSRYFRGRPRAFRDDGSYIAEKWAATKDVPNAAVLEDAFAKEKASYEKMQYCQEKMDKLGKLAELLKQRNIPTIAVINPLHERSVAILRASPVAKQAELWVEEVRQIFPHTVDLRDTKYSKKENFFAADPVHYKPDVGVKFMVEEVLTLADK